MLQGLHTATVAGTAVNPRAVIDAKGTVELLAASQSNVYSCPVLIYLLLPGLITDPVIETARNREHVLRESRESFISFY